MRGQRGFTLVEMVVVIAVLGVLFSILIGITRVVVSQQRYQTTRARMANLDNALTLFVSQYKRLPCPADGTLASGNANAGLEITNGTVGAGRTCTDGSHPNAQLNGVIPWRALGLSASDAEDGWGTRFTYRVGPEMVMDGALDFSSCDPAGASTTVNSAPAYCNAAGPLAGQCNASNIASCTPPNVALTQTTTKGLVVENASGIILMDPRSTATPPVSTGAAYVVISHGPEGGGGYSADGILMSSAVSAGTKEAKNFANIAYSPPPLSGSPGWYLVDDVINGTATSLHFDDLVSRPGILALAVKAGVGPRAH
ncbi:MAG: type II secretion system protein [Betaproteobacteria bacterium]